MDSDLLATPTAVLARVRQVRAVAARSEVELLSWPWSGPTPTPT